MEVDQFTFVFWESDKIIYNEYGNAYYLGNEGNPYAVLIKPKDTSVTNVEIHKDTKLVLNEAFYGCENLSYNEYNNAYYLGNEDNPYMVLVKVKNKDLKQHRQKQNKNIKQAKPKTRKSFK